MRLELSDGPVLQTDVTLVAAEIGANAWPYINEAARRSQPGPTRRYLYFLYARSGTQGASRICLGKKKINFSQVFAGQAVGIKEVHDDI